jgi:hypothetical protein
MSTTLSQSRNPLQGARCPEKLKERTPTRSTRIPHLLGLCFVLLVAFGCIAGCAHTANGIRTEGTVSGTLSNVVVTLTPAAAAAAGPFAPLIEIGSAAVLAGLGAWSLSQERRLRALTDEKKAPTGPTG